MFEATFIHSTIFKQLIDALKDMVTDVNIECTTSGIRAQAMDPSHASLACLKITTEAFETYRCDRNVVLGLNIANLSKILKSLEAGDVLSISYGKSENTVDFCITSKRMDKVANFEIILININPESLAIPDEQADAEVTVPSSKFGQLCKDLATFGDTVQVTASKSSINFSSEGSLGTAKITLRQAVDVDESDAGNVTIDCREEVDESYSLKFLSSFTKATPLAKNVTLNLFRGAPVCVEFKLNDGEWGQLKFYLAPKARENEEQQKG
ncbi:Proliferating cell nuclear antigen [Thelohanellus kitauei]|uniref:DNA sliding clamp PCNA n=1 Tax=Thelohanellus kitauei TaxID=669202 RepID=A0A0C2JDW7_THEKT|nr:Proliferating cell nuclear antigen [Thelohanellus kitauei]